MAGPHVRPSRALPVYVQIPTVLRARCCCSYVTLPQLSQFGAAHHVTALQPYRTPARQQNLAICKLALHPSAASTAAQLTLATQHHSSICCRTPQPEPAAVQQQSGTQSRRLVLQQSHHGFEFQTCVTVIGHTSDVINSNCTCRLHAEPTSSTGARQAGNTSFEQVSNSVM